jgi:hypothetical protein
MGLPEVLTMERSMGVGIDAVQYGRLEWKHRGGLENSARLTKNKHSPRIEM